MRGARRGGPGVRDDRRGGPALGRAAPPARPRPRCARGDFVKIDFGALVDGYHSDMTRTVVLGAAGGLAARAVRAGRRRAGRGPGRARRRASTWPTSTRPRGGVVVDAGRGEEFVHPLGHGVGLQIHEAPLLGATGIGTPGRRAWPSPWSPASTSRVAAACGSRTRSSSRDGAPEVLTRVPQGSAGDLTGLSWKADDGARRRCSAARRTTRGACSPRATDERRSHTAVATSNDIKNGLRAQPRRQSLDRHRIPAREARQGRRLRAHQDEERAHGQGGRQDVQCRHEGGLRDRLRVLYAVPGPSTAPATCSWTRTLSTRST